MPAESARFVVYGTSHQVVLVLMGVCCAALIVLGRKIRGTRWEQVFNRAFALAMLALMLPLSLYLFLPSQWDIYYSLPFDLCDLAWMCAVYCLWTGRNGWAFGPVYYWGLTLTAQALFTPDLAYGYPDPRFALFFLSHCLTPAAAIYLAFGLGFRPTLKLLGGTLVGTIAWAALVLAFNFAFGTNYMYLNAKPENPSLLDVLGPWPVYLLAELGVGLILWSLITLPWLAFPQRESVIVADGESLNAA